MVSLEKQNKASESALVKARFDEVWKDADVAISAARY